MFRPIFVRLKSALQGYRSLAFVVSAFLTLGIFYSIETPIFEAGDEIWHYPFVQSLATGHGLPVQDPARKDLWAQEGGQPPLYYALSAAATFWIDTVDLRDRLWLNPYAKIGIPLAYGNKNLIVHTAAEDFPWHDTALAVHLIRFLSLLLGACTVVLTFLLAEETNSSLPPLRKGGSTITMASPQKEQIIPLLAAALVAFNPMFLFISASVNNDSLAVALASLALLLLVRLATRGMNTGRLVTIGIVCGLGALTKVSDLALLPFAVSVSWWLTWRQIKVKNSSGQLIRRISEFLTPALLITLPFILLAAWWYIRNYVLYGDPLAFNVWLRIAGGRQAPVTLLGLLDEFQGFRISFWGNFGGVNLIAPAWVYTVLDLITLIALLGLVYGLWKRRLPSTLIIPAIWLAIIFVSLVRWTLLTYASQGRLIFPAISAVAVLLAFGLANFRLGEFRLSSFSTADLAPIKYLYILPASFLLAFAVLAPILIITPTYELPLRINGASPAPNPVHIKFEAQGARPELVGYEVDRSVRGGEGLPLTLYWLSATAIPDNLYVYVHLYDAAGQAIGQWEALPGNGLYPTRLWRPNELIVDRYRIPVSQAAIGPQVGRVEAGLTQVGSTVPLRALNPNGEIIVPTIAQFKIPATQSNTTPRPALFKFGDEFDVVNVHLSGTRGGRVFEIDPVNTSNTPLFGGDVLGVALTLRAMRAPDDEYTLFVHVVDPAGKILVQHDGPPGGEGYPTTFWDVGEEVDSQLNLKIPDNVTPGDYKLEVGVYHQRGGVRLSASGNSNGDLAAVGDHLLLTPLPIGK